MHGHAGEQGVSPLIASRLRLGEEEANIGLD
jgi:hypothetical protein